MPDLEKVVRELRGAAEKPDAGDGIARVLAIHMPISSPRRQREWILKMAKASGLPMELFEKALRV